MKNKKKNKSSMFKNLSIIEVLAFLVMLGALYIQNEQLHIQKKEFNTKINDISNIVHNLENEIKERQKNKIESIKDDTEILRVHNKNNQIMNKRDYHENISNNNTLMSILEINIMLNKQLEILSNYIQKSKQPNEYNKLIEERLF